MRSNNLLNLLSKPLLSCFRCIQMCIRVNTFYFFVHALVVHIINLFQKYIFIFNFIFLIFKNYILINSINIMDNTKHIFWPSLRALYYSHMNDKIFKWRHLPFYVLVKCLLSLTNNCPIWNMSRNNLVPHLNKVLVKN